MKFTLIAAMSIATAAALPLAAIASACGGGGEIPKDYDFVTPSGNIICSIYSDGTGAKCEVREHTWAMPASTDGPYGRPCDFSFGGLEFYVSQDKPGDLGCYEGVSMFDYPEESIEALGYGQTQSIGKMACLSEETGVRCTDTVTGHFFRVSRETYELG